MNPIENAMPTNAIAFPRFLTSETSVMMAMLNDILPLLMPPTNRANTNKKKFDDSAHNTYEHAIPTCESMFLKISTNSINFKYSNFGCLPSL